MKTAKGWRQLREKSPAHNGKVTKEDQCKHFLDETKYIAKNKVK